MKYNVYSIHDSAADTFNIPFFHVNDAVAQRMFKQAINDETTSFHQAPKDYTLYLVGEYESDTGELQHAFPTQVINGNSVKDHDEPHLLTNS